MEEFGDVAGRSYGTLAQARKFDQEIGKAIFEGAVMESQQSSTLLNSLILVTALMDRELANIELQRRGASATSEPRLRSLLAKLLDVHTQSYAELESYLKETQSLNEITRQINEMFL